MFPSFKASWGGGGSSSDYSRGAWDGGAKDERGGWDGGGAKTERQEQWRGPPAPQSVRARPTKSAMTCLSYVRVNTVSPLPPR